MIEMTEGQQVLARILMKAGVFRRKQDSPEGKGFKLVQHEMNPDLPLSPFYLEFGLLDPKTLAIIGIELSMAILRESIRSDRGGIRADFIAGVPNAGTPIAGAFCEEIRRISHHVVFPVKPDLIYLVKLLRDGKRAGFDISPESREKAAGGGRVILVDDLITRAHSKMLAIRKLEEAGLEVSAVLVVVDRMQGGAEEMSRAGYRTIWALDIERLLYFYCREKMISMAEYDEFARYLQANY